MPDYNFPDKDDPEFGDKLVRAIEDLFKSNESKMKHFSPISEPEEGKQIGSMWFDSATETIKVNTSNGVRTVSFDP